jgi:hypothetical protein
VTDGRTDGRYAALILWISNDQRIHSGRCCPASNTIRYHSSLDRSALRGSAVARPVYGTDLDRPTVFRHQAHTVSDTTSHCDSKTIITTVEV